MFRYGDKVNVILSCAQDNKVYTDERNVNVNLGMSETIYVAIEAKRKETQDLRYYKKLSLVNSVKSLGVSIKSACCFFGYSVSSYHRIKKDVEGSILQSSSEANWGGRRKAYLSPEQENALANDLANLSESGGFVDIGKIKALMEAMIGKTLHKTTIYRFLERHGFRKIAPRKYHPKRDKEAQEDFKKKIPGAH